MSVTEVNTYMIHPRANFLSALKIKRALLWFFFLLYNMVEILIVDFRLYFVFVGIFLEFFNTIFFVCYIFGTIIGSLYLINLSK